VKSQIKIVKRKPDSTRTDSQAESGTQAVGQSTRDITIVVKRWIAELKERKSSQDVSFTPQRVS